MDGRPITSGEFLEADAGSSWSVDCDGGVEEQVPRSLATGCDGATGFITGFGSFDASLSSAFLRLDAFERLRNFRRCS